MAANVTSRKRKSRDNTVKKEIKRNQFKEWKKKKRESVWNGRLPNAKTANLSPDFV